MIRVNCPYCRGEIKKESKCCSVCGTQYFLNVSKSGYVIFLQEVDGNLCIPIAVTRK